MKFGEELRVGRGVDYSFRSPRVPSLIEFTQFAQNLHHLKEDQLWFMRVAVHVGLGHGTPHPLPIHKILQSGSFHPRWYLRRNFPFFYEPFLLSISIIFPTGKRGGPFSIHQIQSTEQSRGLACIYKNVFLSSCFTDKTIVMGSETLNENRCPQSPTSVGSI